MVRWNSTSSPKEDPGLTRANRPGYISPPFPVPIPVSIGLPRSREERHHAADLPPEQPPPQAQARFPVPHADKEGPCRSQRPTPEGAQAPRRLTHPETTRASWPGLRKRRDFQRAYREGRRWSGTRVRIFVVENDDAGLRVGITVTRKSGKAVRRNRLRRQIRESMRRLLPELPACHRDLVIHVPPGTAVVEFEDLHRELRALVPRALSKPARRRPPRS
jgi:ribonuclease P protein component